MQGKEEIVPLAKAETVFNQQPTQSVPAPTIVDEELNADSSAIFTMPVFSFAKKYLLLALSNMANPSLTMDYVNFFKMVGADKWTKNAAVEEKPQVDSKVTSVATKEEEELEENTKKEITSDSKTGFGYALGLTGQGFMSLLSVVPMAVAFVCHEVVNAVGAVVCGALMVVGLPIDLGAGVVNGVGSLFSGKKETPGEKHAKALGEKALAAQKPSAPQSSSNPHPGSSITPERVDAGPRSQRNKASGSGGQ